MNDWLTHGNEIRQANERWFQNGYFGFRNDLGVDKQTKNVNYSFKPHQLN